MKALASGARHHGGPDYQRHWATSAEPRGWPPRRAALVRPGAVARGWALGEDAPVELDVWLAIHPWHQVSGSAACLGAEEIEVLLAVLAVLAVLPGTCQVCWKQRATAQR